MNSTHQNIINQIGQRNILAISGGRIKATSETTIELPVHAGYHVRIEYNQVPDTYTVTRIFRRGTKEWNKGQVEYIFCYDLGEVAFQASCYLDDFMTEVTA